MSFVRNGKIRFFVCLGILVFVFGMVCLWNSSQQQLEEQQQINIHCEQQQEELNERLQGIVEQKYTLEKNIEHERKEQMEIRRNLEQKIIDSSSKHRKQVMDTHILYEKLDESNKILKIEHEALLKESENTKKKQLSEINGLEKNLQLVKSELEKEKNTNKNEINVWKQKYEAIFHEKDRLEVLLNAGDAKLDLHKRIKELENKIADCETYCKKIGSEQEQIGKPPDSLIAADDINAEKMHHELLNQLKQLKHVIAKPRSQKSFDVQEIVSPGLYHIAIKVTNKTAGTSISITPEALLTNNNFNNFNEIIEKSTTETPVVGNIENENDNVGGADGGGLVSLSLAQSKENDLSFLSRNNHSLIINSVENFQIIPKIIKKVSEETETQLKQQQLDEKTQHQVDDSPKAIIAAPLVAPGKPSSTESSKLEVKGHLNQATNSSSTTSSKLLNLAMPPPNPHRKLPDNVAPIPDMIANEAESHQKVQHIAVLTEQKPENVGDAPVAGGDIDAAIEEMPKNEHNENGKNNRYANVVNDMKQKRSGAEVAAAAGPNDDSGAHEIKDRDFMNDPNFNIPPGGGGPGGDDAGNFFDGDDDKQHQGVDDEDKNAKLNENDEEDMMPGDGGGAVGGDIAVKNQHLLDADNLNNEVAGDQGKEFPDGLRIEEGNEDDGDDDDYQHFVGRQQGEEVIRH